MLTSVLQAAPSQAALEESQILFNSLAWTHVMFQFHFVPSFAASIIVLVLSIVANSVINDEAIKNPDLVNTCLYAIELLVIGAVIQVLMTQADKIYTKVTEVELSCHEIKHEEINAVVRLQSRKSSGEWIEYDAHDQITLDSKNFSLVSDDSSHHRNFQQHKCDNNKDVQDNYLSLRQIIQQMSTGLKI